MFSRLIWVRSTPSRASGRALAVLMLLLLFQMAYWRAISWHYAPHPLLEQPMPVGWMAEAWRWRWAARGLLILTLAGLVMLEFYTRQITAWLENLLADPRRRIGLLVALTLVGRSYLFLPGNVAAGDAAVYTTNIWASRHWIETGNWGIFWTNYAFMGSPYSQFHFTLSYYIPGLIDLFVRSPYLSSKLFILGCHIIMTLAMYTYVRQLTRSQWAGLLSAAIWSSAFFYYHHFVLLGGIVQALTMALLPIQLYALERGFGARMYSRDRVFLGLTVGIQLWVHQLYGGLSIAFTATYMLVRVATHTRFSSWRERAAELFKAVVWLGVGMLIGLYQLLPVYMERGLVGVGDLFEGEFVLKVITLKQAFTFAGSFLDPNWWGGYISPIVLLLALGGVGMVLVTRRRRMYGMVVWLLAAAYLSFGPYYLPFDRIFQRLPFGELVYAIKTPGRYLLFLEFALTVMAGVALKQGVSMIRHLIAGQQIAVIRRLTGQLAVGLGAILFAQAVYTSLRVNSLYPLEWGGALPNRQGAMSWLEIHGDDVSRVLDITYSPGFETTMYTGQPGLRSHGEEAPPSAWLLDALGSQIQQDNQQTALSSDTLELAYLLNVRYLVGDSSVLDNPMPVYQSEQYTIYELPAVTPIIASCQVDVVATSEITELLALMALDQTGRTAAVIPVSSLSFDGAPVCEPSGRPQIELLAQIVEPQYASLTYRTDIRSYAQLSYSYYPYLQILVDGQPVASFRTALDLTGLELPAGEHTIEVVPFLSPLRIISLLIGLLLTLVAGGFGLRVYFLY